MLTRYLQSDLKSDLNKKMVLLSGPRQVGKTTLAKSISNNLYYLNYDVVKDRKIILSQSWDKDSKLIVFDELHKLKKWKSWLKGVWDDTSRRSNILVTGSARLEIYKKGGDSLAGRYFNYRLHPLSVKELIEEYAPDKCVTRLIERGGFPEPFLVKNIEDSFKWRLNHLDRIVRDDVSAVEKIYDIRQLELLVELLSERVGSPISYQNLSEDLSVSPPTVKRWIEVLESLYVIFCVRPYSKSIKRSIKKEPKVYFYDIARVKDDIGMRLENLVACHLMKRAHFITDTKGIKSELSYIRNKEKKEVDFITLSNSKPEMMIEVKAGDDSVSKNLVYFKERSNCKAIQLVHKLERNMTKSDISITNLSSWLANLEV